MQNSVCCVVVRWREVVSCGVLRRCTAQQCTVRYGKVMVTWWCALLRVAAVASTAQRISPQRELPREMLKLKTCGNETCYVSACSCGKVVVSVTVIRGLQ